MCAGGCSIQFCGVLARTIRPVANTAASASFSSQEAHQLSIGKCKILAKTSIKLDYFIYIFFNWLIHPQILCQLSGSRACELIIYITGNYCRDVLINIFWPRYFKIGCLPILTLIKYLYLLKCDLTCIWLVEMTRVAYLIKVLLQKYQVFNIILYIWYEWKIKLTDWESLSSCDAISDREKTSAGVAATTETLGHMTVQWCYRYKVPSSQMIFGWLKTPAVERALYPDNNRQVSFGLSSSYTQN